MDQTHTGGASGEEPAKRITIGGDASAAATAGSAAAFGCFDCNICLECATEPVVTLCGHLYCWPCIYEWLCPATDAEAEADDAMSSTSTRRQCPVCKAALSPDVLVPLYGRGLGSSSAKKPTRTSSVPRRPALRRQSAQGIGSGGDRHRHLETAGAPAARTPRQFDGAVLPTVFGDRGGGGMMQSTAGGMAVAVLPWVLRGQGPPPGIYYSGSYDLMNPRQRRWHMELERSLHQLWFFLFVFVVLCLLLF